MLTTKAVCGWMIDIIWHNWQIAWQQLIRPVVLTLPIADCHSGKTDKYESNPKDEDNHEEDCVVFSWGKVEFCSSPVRGIIWEK